MTRDDTKYLLLRVCIVALALASFMGSCGGPAGPEDVARSFLKAAREQDCEKVWRSFSAETQKMIVAEAARLEAEGYGQGANGMMYTDAFEYKNLYCKPTMVNPYLAYAPGSVKLIKAEGDRAVVGVQEGEGGGFLIPGFFPTETIFHQREMKLVKEGGTWKVDRTK